MFKGFAKRSQSLLCMILCALAHSGQLPADTGIDRAESDSSAGRSSEVKNRNLARSRGIPQARLELRTDPDAQIVERQLLYPYPHKHLTVSDVSEITHLQRQWIPSSEGSFPCMIAHPREATFSLAWRKHDKAFNDKIVAVSLGDTFPLYRWEGLGPQSSGFLQLAIEGGLWAVFDYPDNDPDLVNSDYMVGIPLSYASGRWHVRGRIYHISSHLGDEFMDGHRGFVRLNPSFEALDVYGMCDINDHVRAYSGLGYILRSDKTFHLRRLYGDLGLELRALKNYFKGRNLVMQPFFATNLHAAQTHHWRFESNTDLGIEWSQMPGTGRQLRTYLEYYTGYSLEGQFANIRTNYLALKVSYSY